MPVPPVPERPALTRPVGGDQEHRGKAQSDATLSG